MMLVVVSLRNLRRFRAIYQFVVREAPQIERDMRSQRCQNLLSRKAIEKAIFETVSLVASHHIVTDAHDSTRVHAKSF